MNRKCFSPPEPQDADPRSIEAPFPVSAVLLVTLIRRVLGDISLLPLLAQIRARRLVIGRVVFDLRSVAGTLGAAIFFRDRGQFAHGNAHSHECLFFNAACSSMFRARAPAAIEGERLSPDVRLARRSTDLHRATRSADGSRRKVGAEMKASAIDKDRADDTVYSGGWNVGRICGTCGYETCGYETCGASESMR
jgi:hypothetical protein